MAKRPCPEKEAFWRSVLQRHCESGLSITDFCHAESICRGAPENGPSVVPFQRTHRPSESATLPGLLVQDSPREADLSIRLYSNFMRFVASRKNHFASPNKCPFQYILTTTTKPPKELRGNKHVKLELDASKPGELLFRRDLSAAAATANATRNGEFDFSERQDGTETDPA